MAARRRTVELGPALHIAHEVLVGLHYAHTVCDAHGTALRLVHRDVAPNNILLGQSGRVKLADFGIVRSAVSDVRTAPGEIRGKIGYVSPEQALGRVVDARSDLFSLGVVLAEMLIAEPLFGGKDEIEVLAALHAGDLSRLNARSKHIPRSVQTILRRALASDPGRRYLTARHFATDLDAAIREFGRPMSSYELAEWLADLGLISLKSGVQVSSQPLPPTEPPLTSLTFVPPAGEAARVTLPDDQAYPTASTRTVPASREEQASYRMRRPGATIVGPLSLSRVLEMLATARMGMDTEVSRSGGPFMPLSACVELSRLAARPEYRFFEPIAYIAAERCPIDRRSLPAQLFRWAGLKSTGLCCARNNRGQQRIYLVDGVPSASASTNPDELLGANLIAGGLLTSSQLDRALEDGHRSGQPIGQALIAANLLRPDALLRSLALQRTQRLASLLRFDQGELYFVDKVVASAEALALPLSPFQCIAAAVRVAYSALELRELLVGLEDKALARSVEYSRLRTALDLPREEAHAMEWAARAVSLSVILRDARARSAEAETAALRAVFLGLACGALGVP